MSARVAPGFGERGELYAAVCGEGHERPYTSPRGTAVDAMNYATNHNTVHHPATLPAELDMNGTDDDA